MFLQLICSVGARKPYYLGPWTLRKAFFKGGHIFIELIDSNAEDS